LQHGEKAQLSARAPSVMSNALYSFGSSTGNEPCTSPSEMLAAAVAACVPLMVAQEMAKAHAKYENVRTEAVLTLREKTGHWDVSGIELHINTHLPEREAAQFQKPQKSRRAVSDFPCFERADQDDRETGAGRGRCPGLNGRAVFAPEGNGNPCLRCRAVRGTCA
jgi:organic hydroperoxide reductase OsmC/OhrA